MVHKLKQDAPKIVGVVKFWDLGRGHASGSFKVEANDEQDFNDQLEREFGKHLVSSDIAFADGKIYTGFHNVGRFEFVAVEKKD